MKLQGRLCRLASLRKILLSFVLALLLAGVARADIYTVVYTSSPFSSGINGTGFTALVPQFDPQLGTLVGASATMDLSLQLDPMVWVWNTTNHPIVVNATTQVTPSTGNPLSWTDPYGNKGTVYYSYTASGVTAAPGHVTVFADPNWVTAPPLVTVVPAYDWINFTGTGTYPVNYSIGGSINSFGTIVYNFGPGSTIFYGSKYNVAGIDTIIYEYVQVPAPAGILLGLLGLTGLGLLMRRYA